MTAALSVRDLALRYGRRLVLTGVSFDLAPGQCLGVVGPSGSGKTTLLRSLVGCLTPVVGDVRIDGLQPRHALARVGVAYFAGEATVPGFVRASRWGTLGTGETVTADRRPLRALSRGTRQSIGLRTALGRHPLGLIILDEPWEGLDADASRWLTMTLESKRDRGAAIVISSHRTTDLVSLCDAYLVLDNRGAMWLQAHELAPDGHVTADVLMAASERIRQQRLLRSG